MTGVVSERVLTVNQNFKNMADDFNDQRRVINSLGKALDTCRQEQRELRKRLVTSMDNLRRMANTLSNQVSEEMALGVQLCQDISLLMAWSKEMEDSAMMVMLEHLQKLEDRMAKKDAEIAALQGKVC